jgi:E3 ubiquitin-protein ligase BRE1
MTSVTSRKRSRSIETDAVASKKLHLSSDAAAPVNGVTPPGKSSDEPQNNSHIEMFRKEAIYRKMKHYSRENERYQARIAALEQRKNTCEAGLAAMSACWTQLLNTIRVLTSPEDLPPIETDLQGALDMAAFVMEPEEQPDLVQGLQEGMQATGNIVLRLIEGKHSFNRERPFLDCQTAQSECISLRTQVTDMRNKLQQAEERNNIYHEQLVLAESRLDRLNSRSIALVHGSNEQPTSEAQPPKNSGVPDPSQSPPPLDSKGNDAHRGPLDDDKLRHTIEKPLWEEIRRLKDAEIRWKSDYLKAVYEFKAAFPTDLVIKSPQYDALKSHCSKLKDTIQEHVKRIELQQEEISNLTKSHANLKQSIQSEITQQCQDLQNLVLKREVEGERLREQRDKAVAELNDRKARDSVKLNSLHEYKQLCEAQSGRINLLNVEISRLKARLAADTNNEDAMQFFLAQSSGQNADVSYHEDLQKRLRNAEQRSVALEETLAQIQTDNPQLGESARTESAARQELARVQQLLAKYQSVYGESSSLSPDVQSLSTELQKKDETISHLRLQMQEHVQTETGLYTELEKLSAAWEALERQLKHRTDQLQALEERARQSQQERAKAENKYFSAMKEKEAAMSETKHATRNCDKHAKLLEKCTLLREAAEQRQAELEREHSNHVTRELQLMHARDEMYQKMVQAQSDLDVSQKNYSPIKKAVDHHLHLLYDEGKRACEARVTAEHLRDQVKKELKQQQQQQQQQLVQGAPEKVAEKYQSEIEKLNSILKCSTCQQAYRKMIITKCMHTFCKPCIDSRVASRQRKCPSCALPFSQSDVQQFYFQ